MVYQNKGLDEILVKFVLRNYIYMNRTREKEKGDCHEREATEKGQTVMREKRLVKFHHPTCQKFFRMSGQGMVTTIGTVVTAATGVKKF